MSYLAGKIVARDDELVRSMIHRQMARLARNGFNPTWEVFERTPAWTMLRDDMTDYTRERFKAMWIEQTTRLPKTRTGERQESECRTAI